MTASTAQSRTQRARRTVGDWVGKGWSLYDKALVNSVKSWRFATYNTNAWLRGSVFPVMDSAVAMNRTLGDSVKRAVGGENAVVDVLLETADRFDAAWRYARLVNTVGKRAFGSATYEGETVLAEHGAYRLSYLPARGERQPLAVFHAGGAIPYGDRIFRFTPEYNFFDRFLERGVAVYAMELVGDRSEHDAGGLDIDELVGTIEALSDAAFAHHGRKLVLEGYCGHGTQLLPYLAARPGDANRKFHTVATFVAPVDGRRCTSLAESIATAPDGLMEAQFKLWKWLHGYVPGDALRLGLDMALGTVFYKTLAGYFAAGFQRPALAGTRATDELDAETRRELAGAYWISPDCARRFPVPVEISRFTTQLFTEGIGPTGELPGRVEGASRSLKTVVEQTSLRVVGFYGGLDEVVPDRTAHALIGLFGDRYRHVVHRNAGHISYVLSPAVWRSGHPAALDPNPVDLLLEIAAEAGAA